MQSRMTHASYSVDGVSGVLSSYDAKWLLKHMDEMTNFFGSRMTIGIVTCDLEKVKGEKK